VRGHQPLFELRKQGVKPPMVHIAAMQTNGLAQRKWPEDGGTPSVEIAPGENLQRLDLRCFKGLRVLVFGFDDGHVDAVARACQEAGAEPIHTFGSRNTTERFDG
jgi:hypothetical protein